MKYELTQASKNWATACRACWGALTAIVMLTAGCAIPQWAHDMSAETSELSSTHERSQATLASFKSRREDAAIQAATAFWRQGDADVCERNLLALVEENPSCTKAHLTLAELYGTQNRTNLAEAHFYKVLTEEPDNVEALHGLGLVLAESNRGAEAEVILLRAKSVAPDNHLIATAYDSVSTKPSQHLVQTVAGELPSFTPNARVAVASRMSAKVGQQSITPSTTIYPQARSRESGTNGHFLRESRKYSVPSKHWR